MNVSLSRRACLAFLLALVQDCLLPPGAWLAFTSPLWGTAVGLGLGWPWWLVAGLALSPLTALLLNGALDEALEGPAMRRPLPVASLELATAALYIGLFLGLPLGGHYFLGW